MVVVVMGDEDCVAAREVGNLARGVIEAAGASPCSWAGAEREDGIEEEVEALLR